MENFDKFRAMATEIAEVYKDYRMHLYKILAPIYFKGSASWLKNQIRAIYAMEKINPTIATKKFAWIYFLSDLFDHDGLALAKQILLFDEEQNALDFISSLDAYSAWDDENELIVKLSDVFHDLLLYHNGMSRYHGNLVALLENNPLSALLKWVDRSTIQLDNYTMNYWINWQEREIKRRLKDTFGMEKVLIPPLNRCRTDYLSQIDLDVSFEKKQLSLLSPDGEQPPFELDHIYKKALAEKSLGAQVKTFLEQSIEARYQWRDIPYKTFGVSTVKKILKIQLISKLKLQMSDITNYKTSNKKFLLALLNIFDVLKSHQANADSQPHGESDYSWHRN